MNEITRLLKEKSESTHFPLSLPNMDDVVDAQEAMLIHIPDELKDYLLNYSDALYGYLEPATLADPQSHTYLPEMASQAWERGLPREMLPICVDRTKVYCIASTGEIFVWTEMFGEECEHVCDDIWQWIRDIWLAE